VMWPYMYLQSSQHALPAYDVASAT